MFGNFLKSFVNKQDVGSYLLDFSHVLFEPIHFTSILFHASPFLVNSILLLLISLSTRFTTFGLRISTVLFGSAPFRVSYTHLLTIPLHFQLITLIHIQLFYSPLRSYPFLFFTYHIHTHPSHLDSASLPSVSIFVHASPFPFNLRPLLSFPIPLLSSQILTFPYRINSSQFYSISRHISYVLHQSAPPLFRTARLWSIPSRLDTNPVRSNPYRYQSFPARITSPPIRFHSCPF